MRESKYHIALDENGRRMVIDSWNRMWNKRIAASKCADAVDDILLIVANSPIKKIKVKYEEVQ